MPATADSNLEPIAIIGLAAALPGECKSLQHLWNIILAGQSTASKVPKDRFNIETFYHESSNRLGATNTQYGHFLDRDLGAFDAGLFNIPPQEAESIDPAQRILLETAYHALENAGMPMESVAGSNMACYVGASGKDYECLLLRDPDYQAKYTMTGIGTAMLANRVSWFFDLRGASFTLDTGCSSSVTALHQACAALRTRESDSALVGGSNLSIVPDAGIIPLSNMGFLSPDGRCWSFDSRANGFGRADGQGFIVLKRLSDAVKDGDVVRAIIRSTALNQDGHTPGLTMPNADSQVSNIVAAYQAGGLDINSTAYFEAHGTGTQVGDLIETQAIHKAFKTSPENPLFVGSVKANVGHLEAAAGLAGIFKSIFMLESGLIPREACAAEGKPNPRIPFIEWGLTITSTTIPWPKQGLRRISLNSFGYGGSNAHVVLDDTLHYCEEKGIPVYHLTKAREIQVNSHINGTGDNANGNHSSSQPKPRMFMISSADEAGIERIVKELETHFSSKRSMLEETAESYLASLAYTLNDRRSRLPWKSFFLASSFSELWGELSSKVSKPIRSSVRPPIILIFSGQGANYAQMGIDLIPVYRVFRQSIEKSDHLMRSWGSDWSLIDEIRKSNEETQVSVPRLSQPLATALQIALFDLVESWGLAPTTVIGHSSGEIAAAYAIGALSHDSAIKVAYFRGVVADNLEKSGKVVGTMSSVGLSEEDIAPYITQMEAKYDHQCIQVACVNSNVNVTLTGQKTAMDTLSTLLEEKGIFCRRLAITVPYHSVHMELVSHEYLRLLGKLYSKYPMKTVPKGQSLQKEPIMFSSVTEHVVLQEALRNPQYWVENLVNPVRFCHALKNLIASAVRPEGCSGQILEIAPHAVLQRSIRDILSAIKQESNFEYESLLFRNKPAIINCVKAVGRLACRNLPINISKMNNFSLNETIVAPLTDLPNYPFNHSQSYWHESRISKNHRFRRFCRHELIGNLAVDWNPLEPRWRNFINASEIPWLQDCKLNDKAILPPAALLTMPIEAMRQLYDYKDDFLAYELNNISFGSPLSFNSEKKQVEVQVVLQPVQMFVSDLDSTYKFTIYAWEGNESHILCSGRLSGKLQDPIFEERSVTQQEIEEYSTECVESIDPNLFYKNIGDMGYFAHPSFQKVSSNIRFNGHSKAIADIDIAKNEVPMAGTGENRYLLHPTALESILQLNKAAVATGSLKQVPRLLPTSLKKLYIADPTKWNAQIKLQATANVISKGFCEVETTISAMDASLKPLVVASNLWEKSEFNLDSFQAEPNLHVSSIVWKPDLTLLSTEQVVEYLHASILQRGSAAPSQSHVDQQELLSLHAVAEALKAVDRETAATLPEFLQRYYAWMESVLDREKYASLLAAYPRFADPITRTTYLESFTARDKTGELINETSKAIIPILRGDMSGLDLLFSSGLADRFYSSGVHDLAYDRISAFTELKAHKNPELKILEVGAGTGGATHSTLRALSCEGGDADVPRFSEYCFTDISPSFFEKAREKFSSRISRMAFKVLDIEKPPVLQGFKENRYDIIIASLVLHATSDLRKTLRHVRSLLKEGGQLILYETTGVKTSRVGLTFGLIPGWWLGIEPERQLTPCVSTQGWHEALMDAGFGGVDFDLPDHDTADHKSQSVMVATAKSLPTEELPTTLEHVVLVVNDKDVSQVKLANSIKALGGDSALTHFVVVTIQQLATLHLENAIYVFLVESEHSLLKNISEIDFNTLKFVFTCKKVRVIWVTGGCSLTAETPDLGIFTGLGRTLTTERIDCRYTELSLGNADNDTSAAIVWATVGRLANTRISHEPEIACRKGVLHIPRIVPSTALNRHLKDQLVRPESELKPLNDRGSRSLALSMKKPGDFDTFHFVDAPDSAGPLATDEVIVRIKASGIHTQDYFVAQGQKIGTAFGNEFSGVVARASEKSKFEVGSRVYGYCATGSISTHIRIKVSNIAHIPSSMSFTEAAGLPFALSAAYYALFRIARLDVADTVLIRGNGSNMGLVAAQMINAFGATVHVSVRNQEEIGILSNYFDLTQDRIHIGVDAPVSEFDVVLDLDNGVESFSSQIHLADGGKLIKLIQSLSKQDSSHISIESKNISYSSVDFRAALESGSAKTAHLLDAISRLFSATEMGARSLLPPPEVFSVADLKSAFERVHEMNESHLNGKVVVEMDENAQVQVAPAPRVPHKFTENATYVIAGGFGGLGRTVIPWMADRGARNFIVLSRSGASSEAAKDLITNMEKQGIRIEGLKCDLMSAESVSGAIDRVKGSMPRIKGCLQCAMVLSDSVFENILYVHWLEAIKPKVQGTWSLHTVLPRGMEFFIMLSSIAGVIGSAGQSNYAAGNTFQDALARHRRAQGEHGIALDLAAISGVGAVAERNLDNDFYRRGIGSMPKLDFLTCLEYCFSPGLNEYPEITQMVTGLGYFTTLSSVAKDDIAWSKKPLFNVLRNSKISDAVLDIATPEKTTPLPILLQNASDDTAATEIVLHALRAVLARVLSVSTMDIDSSLPVYASGVDSLIALELRNWFSDEVGADVPISELMRDQSLFELVEMTATNNIFRAGNKDGQE